MLTPKPRNARGRLSRALAPLLAVLLLSACDVPWSSSPPPTLTPLSTVQAGTPVSVGAGLWQRISLPVPLGAGIGYAVSPNDPDTLFVCSGLDQPNTRMLWRTTDAGTHWTHLATLGGIGVACLIAIAPDDAQRVLVQISSGVQHGQFCASDVDYLSNDGGASWKRLAPYALNIPASAPYDSCELELSRDYLFLSLASSDPSKLGSLLARSDDEGQTWRRIGGTIGDGALFFQPEIGPGDSLAMTVLHFTTPSNGDTAELWTSADAGTIWTKASDVSDYAGGFLFTSLPTPGGSWPSASHPFYALVSEQIPSDLYYESVLASSDGVRWSKVPNLPVPGVSDERHGILQSLATLSDGRLAVWGVDPQVGLPSASDVPHPQKPFWLWLWTPSANAWQVVETPLNVTAYEGCGLCWQATSSTVVDGSTTLYVAGTYGDPFGNPPLGIFRVRIPAA